MSSDVNRPKQSPSEATTVIPAPVLGTEAEANNNLQEQFVDQRHFSTSKVQGQNEEDNSHTDLDAFRNSRRISRHSTGLRRSFSPARSIVDAEEGLQQGQTGVDSGVPEEAKGKALAGPAWLLTCTEKVQVCSNSIQGWADRQEENARLKKQNKSNAEVVIDEEGRGIEPKGDSWLQRKGIIFVVAIILTWVYIVFTWRICAAGIRMEQRALINKSEGIGILVGFNVLWLMTMWTYVKVISTGPGYVRDHISIAEAPIPPSNPHNGSVAALYPSASMEPSTESDPSTVQTTASKRTASIDASKVGATEESVDSTFPAVFGPLGAGQAAKVDEEKAMNAQSKAPNLQDSWQAHQQQPELTVNGVPEPMRIPPQSAPLHPNNLYCHRCKRYKPPRAHHCRHCATCVLKMDHHCPWVGGCVGARNHKFFYHFLQWVTMLEIYVLIINAISFNRGIHRRFSNGPGWSIDGYMISLFPITAIFTLFTTTLLITHSYLFLLNLTTIEHMSYDRMKTREDILLERYLQARKDSGEKEMTFRGKLQEKKRMKNKWADQWGNLKTEANLWWLDNEQKAKASQGRRHWYQSIGPNWTAAMGMQWYEWILPIGQGKSDGLSYDTNWRFSSDGTWRMREAWTTAKEKQQ